MDVGRAHRRPSSPVWCLLQQPPTPPLNSQLSLSHPPGPRLRPPQSRTPAPRGACLGPAHLPPAPSLLLGAHSSPLIWKVDTAWSRHSACMLGLRGWRGTGASPILWPPRCVRALAWPHMADAWETSLPDTTFHNLRITVQRGGGGQGRATWESRVLDAEPGSGPAGLRDEAPAPERQGTALVRQTAHPAHPGAHGARQPSSRLAH